MATVVLIDVRDITGKVDGDAVSSFTDSNGVAFEFDGAAPIYKVVAGKPCLRFDGSTKGIKTVSTLDLSPTVILQVFMVAKLNNSVLGIMVEHSVDYNSHDGGFIIYAETNDKLNLGISTPQNNFDTVSTFASLKLLMAILDRSAAGASEVTLEVDTASETPVNTFPNNTSGNFGDFKLFVGGRSGNVVPKAMDLYYLRIENEVLSGTPKTDIEQDLGGYLGLSYYTPPTDPPTAGFSIPSTLGARQPLVITNSASLATSYEYRRGGTLVYSGASGSPNLTEFLINGDNPIEQTAINDNGFDVATHTVNVTIEEEDNGNNLPFEGMRAAGIILEVSVRARNPATGQVSVWSDWTPMNISGGGGGGGSPLTIGGEDLTIGGESLTV